jgi:hypothetical protein
MRTLALVALLACMDPVPAGAPQGPEPTVWIGLAEDVNDDGTVDWAYPAWYAHTHRPDGIWGLERWDTDRFHGGAADLFDRNGFGSDVMADGTQSPIEIFDRTGRLLNIAFTHARSLGVQTALGTELPLGLEPKGPEVGVDWIRGMPPELVERLTDQGLDPADPAVVKEVYRGIFTRIMRTHPLDYYWVWTWEGWSVHGVSRRQIKAVEADLQLAYEAADELDAPFRMAVAGWVVGTADESAVFDESIPDEVPFVGLWDEADGFDELGKDRIKWPATWLEEDWGLAQPQLEARRVHRDVRAAFDTESDGIVAKHWRTRILGSNLAALKAATWAYGPTDGPLESAVDLPTTRFVERTLEDWSIRQFGDEAGPDIARLLARLDNAGETGDGIPSALGWDNHREDGGDSSPVAIVSRDRGRWDDAEADYAFVGELESLRPEVVGAGNLERFDYWLASFQVLRLMGEYGYVRGAYERTIADEQFEAALTHRRRMARLFEQIEGLQAQKATNASDLGEIAMLEQLNWHQLVQLKSDGALERGLGAPIPEDANPSQEYTGPPRVVVKTPRTAVVLGQPLAVQALVPGGADEVLLHWRQMGPGPFQTTALEHVARGVYRTTLPPLEWDLEYWVEAETSSGSAVFPASAPDLNHTVVVMPPMSPVEG